MRLEEGLEIGAGDEAWPKVGVEESSAHKVGAIEGGGRARGSGVGDRWQNSGVFEGKEGIGKVREGFTNTLKTSRGEEDVETAVVFGGGEIEPASAVFGPRLVGERRVKGDDELAGEVDGVGGKVEGHKMKTMVSRDGRVDEGPRAHVVY